ncbi:hypothetical protein [Erwinia phage FBB1]|nr:hypothetical protein [Erwinia phage FBB1]
MENIQQLDEVLDENTTIYPAINLKPNLKLPQVWKFDVPGNDTLMARMVSFASEGDTVKNVKMGDKFVQVFLMSLSDKGNCGELRGGLGSDPYGAITTIFDMVYVQAKQYRFDAVLFRLPIKKMKGQHNAVQRIMARLAQIHTGGKFVVLKELWDYSNKYAYVLIKRKNVNLEDIQGIPKISSELFTAVETKVGTTYVSKESGNPVTKDEALAATIAQVEDNRSSDRQIAAKTKISRRDAIASQYSNVHAAATNSWSQGRREERDKLNANPPVFSGGEPSAAVKNVSDGAMKAVSESFRARRDAIINGKEISSVPEAYALKKYANNFNKSAHMRTPRTEVEIDNMVKEGTIKYFEIASRYNGKNALEIFKELSNIMLDTYEGYELLPSQRADYISHMLMTFNDDVTKEYRKMYSAMSDYLAPDLTDAAEISALERYTRSFFGEINDYLIGSESTTDKVVKEVIPALDRVFEKGTTMPKGTPLYRGMRLGDETFRKTLESKIFYFNNYVSTSLFPAFVGMYGNTGSALDDVNNQEIEFDGDVNGSEIKLKKYLVKIGLVINDTHLIKSVVPGKYTGHPSECEVILPRGTAVRFTKAWVSNDVFDTKAIVESKIIAPEQLTESTEIYDGDALINEGVVKKLDFMRFIKEQEEDIDEPVMVVQETPSKSIIQPVDDNMKLLLGLVSFDDLSDKFTDC